MEMATHRWDDLKHKASGVRRAEIHREVQEEILQASLREARELAGKTQSEVAAVIEMSQGQVSEMERRDDHRISTVRRYIQALGGELEIVAKFGDKTLRLHGV
jgi:predicted transcriptional regulator